MGPKSKTMSDYLERPMTVRQSDCLIRFLMVMFNFKLISEETLADTEYHFDTFAWETRHLPWQDSLLEWAENNG